MGLLLNALPVLLLGTLLDSESFRVAIVIRVFTDICIPHSCLRALGWPLPLEWASKVAIALRVGTDVCIPHSWCWGGRMDSRGLHGLSCKYSAGLLPRHSEINDVIKRALQKAGLRSVLEPLGLDWGDWPGSRRGPDGITVFPSSGGRSLVWDCTCVDTFAGVHQNRSAMEAGTAAINAEERKRRKYSALAEAHQFDPITVEMMGVYGGDHWSHLEGNRPSPCWSDRGAQWG